ncbi:MAG: zf-HC2 domain-containing protein, partial [Candidatus Rokubacteria bacterium]|nr:zf-HC2 domain-containing protein [Candidatus Rokubacteria bacterium]
PMTCEEVPARFTALIDDDVTPDERAALERHLAGCADCAREWTRFADAVRRVRALEPARAPAGFVDRVLAAAAPTPWYWRLLGGVPPAVRWATAAAALAIVVVIGYAARQPVPLGTNGAGPRTGATPFEGAGPRAVATPFEGAGSRAVATPAPAGSEGTGARPAPSDVAAAREAAAPPERTAAETPAVATIEPSPTPRAAPAAPGRTREPAETREAPAALRAAPAPTMRRESRAPDEALARRSDERARGFDGKSADRVEAYRPTAVAPAAPGRVPNAVVGRLAVLDPAAVEQVLGGLAARFDARLVSRTAAAGGVTLDFAVPPATVPRFLDEIARLGRWAPERAADSAAARTRVIIHLTR